MVAVVAAVVAVAMVVVTEPPPLCISWFIRFLVSLLSWFYCYSFLLSSTELGLYLVSICSLLLLSSSIAVLLDGGGGALPTLFHPPFLSRQVWVCAIVGGFLLVHQWPMVR